MSQGKLILEIIDGRQDERRVFKEQLAKKFDESKKTHKQLQGMIRDINKFEDYKGVKISTHGSIKSLYMRIREYCLYIIDPVQIILSSKIYDNELCKHDGCITRASYGRDDKLEMCGKHKTIDMLDVINKMCAGCNNVRPTFGFPNGKATHCGSCRLYGMVDLVSKMCKVCNKINVAFGFPNGKATHCGSCKLDGMVDLKNKTCISCNNTRATFGVLGGKATHCGSCKISNMVDLISKMCEVCEKIRPVFGVFGGKATHCGSCKIDGMINVKDRMCEVCNDVQPSFGFYGGKATHCGSCKIDGMVNVVSKMCESCFVTRATFGVLGGKATHCGSCKLDGMVDVKNRFCELCNNIRPHFGLPGHPPSRCFRCKEENMIKTSKRLCEFKQCREVATHGDGIHTRHCEVHKESEEIDMLNRPCVTCKLTWILNKNGKCWSCEAPPKRSLAKQHIINDYFDSNNYKYDSTDRIFGDTACGKERPDFLFDHARLLVITECDEDQHKDRNPECEFARMVNLTQAYHRPIIWIRFNPDSYTGKEEYTIHQRLAQLGKAVDAAFALARSDQTLNFIMRVQYLFYNGNNQRYHDYTEQDIIDYCVNRGMNYNI